MLAVNWSEHLLRVVASFVRPIRRFVLAAELVWRFIEQINQRTGVHGLDIVTIGIATLRPKHRAQRLFVRVGPSMVKHGTWLGV